VLLNRSVFFVLHQNDFVGALPLTSSPLSHRSSRTPRAPPVEPSPKAAEPAAAPSPEKAAPASAAAKPGDVDAPMKKGVSFASQEESNVLPEGWTAHEDPASKKTYFVSASGETTWEKPAHQSSSEF